MADIPFFGGVATSGGGSGGTTNYDMLINKPVINVSGDPVVICDLETGVYNIEGTWSITSDDVKRETLKDDLFYVSNDEVECRLTWISAGMFHTYQVPSGGSASDISEDTLATADGVISQMVGEF